MTQRGVDVRGRRVSYVETGPSRAPPILCLHGAGFDDSSLTWRPSVMMLRETRRVIVPDIPGYGASDALAGTPTLPRLGAWTGDFLDAIGVERADVAGLSMGGGMALWLAIHRPKRVHRLIPVCPYGLMARAPFHRAVVLAHRAGILPLAYRAASLSNGLARLGLALSYADPSRVTSSTVAQLRRVARDQKGRGTFDAFLSAEMDAHGLKTDLTGDLGRVRAPTLLVAGQYDRLVPHRHVRAARERVADCRYLLLPTGHWPMCERPDLFNRALSEFLSD